MNFIAGNLYHIYNQGNNKQVIFSCPDDYLTFIRELRLRISPHVEIIAYCLMPNHFHLLVYSDERVSSFIKQGGIVLDPLTNGIRKLLSGYARIFNKRYNCSGSVFRQKTKNKCLTEMTVQDPMKVAYQDYCINCFHYIHQNPLKADLVSRMEDWEYSSFRDYAGLRNGSLCNKELAVIYCNYVYETFYEESYRIIDESIFKWSDRDGQTR